MTAEWQRRQIGSCPSGCISFAYDLDVRVDDDIIPFLERFGKPALPFRKTSYLKVLGPACTIIGIRKLKEIRLMIGKGAEIAKIVQEFEIALNEWLVYRIEQQED